MDVRFAIKGSKFWCVAHGGMLVFFLGNRLVLAVINGKVAYANLHLVSCLLLGFFRWFKIHFSTFVYTRWVG